MPLKITVGIATWNRCELLKQTLEAMTQLRIPEGVSWEILVCDNNSTDMTKAIVEGFTERLPVRYLFEPAQGKSHALNHIIDQATGDWIIYTDDDVRVEPDWIDAHRDAIAKYPEATLLGGQVLPWLEKPVKGQAAYLLKTFPWVNAVLTFDEDTPIINKGGHMPYGNNMAVRTDVLRKHPFDPQSTMKGGQRGAEDTELVERLLLLGHRGWLVANSKLSHYIPADRVGFKWWCKWHLGAGTYWIKDKGPTPPPRWGMRWWLWKLSIIRMGQALIRWRPSTRRKAYECIADMFMHIGYARASDALRRP